MKKHVEFAKMDNVKSDQAEVQPDKESVSDEDEDLNEEGMNETKAECFWKDVDDRGEGAKIKHHKLINLKRAAGYYIPPSVNRLPMNWFPR